MSKPLLAYTAYLVGAVAGIAIAVAGITSGQLESAVAGVAYAAAVWWLAAGIAVRLGRTPRDLVGSLATLFGRGRR